MTVKEFLEYLNDLAMTDDSYLDFQIVTTGYDEWGNRKHNIPTKDATCNYDDKVIRIWDL